MNKTISISINKELLAAFRKLSEQEYTMKYQNFIEGFLYFGGLIDLKKIFEFRGYPYQEYYDIDEDGEQNTTSFKVTLNEYDRIKEKVEEKNITLSVYIREFITLCTTYPKDFDKIFNRYKLDYYKEDNYYKLLNMIKQEIQTIPEYNFYLVQNLDVLDKTIEKTINELNEVKVEIVYSDFKFEKLMLKQYEQKNLKKFSQLNELEQEKHEIKKDEYKTFKNVEIMSLKIKCTKLVVIYIYKCLANEQKNIPQNYLEFKRAIYAQYDKYKQKETVSIYEYLTMLMYNDNELLRFFHTKTINYSNLLPKPPNF